LSSTTPSNSSNSLEELTHLPAKPSETIKFKLLKRIKTSSNRNKSIESVCNNDKTSDSHLKNSYLIKKSSDSMNKSHFDCDDLFGNSMSYNIIKPKVKKNNNYVDELLIRNYDNSNIITNSSSNDELNRSTFESKKTSKINTIQHKSNDSKIESSKVGFNLKTVFQDNKPIPSKNNNLKSATSRINRPNIYDNNVNNRKNIYIIKDSDLKSKSCERIDELDPSKSNDENFSLVKNENEKLKLLNNNGSTKFKNNENNNITNNNLITKKLNYSKSLKYIQTNSDDLNESNCKSLYSRKGQNVKINSIGEPIWKEIAFKKHNAWYNLAINHFILKLFI
jgi:hypothetical protein